MYRDRRMICPRCGVDLAFEGSREHWRCSACHGALLERRTLAGELAAGDWVAAERDAAPVGCPACTERMRTYRVLGVDVELCQRDELVWFDGGELGFVRAYLDAEESER